MVNKTSLSIAIAIILIAIIGFLWYAREDAPLDPQTVIPETNQNSAPLDSTVNGTIDPQEISTELDGLEINDIENELQSLENEINQL